MRGIRKGYWVKVKVHYPKSPRLNGEWAGRVAKVGQYPSGYVYFKLEGLPYAFPLSSKYTKVEEVWR